MGKRIDETLSEQFLYQGTTSVVPQVLPNELGLWPLRPFHNPSQKRVKENRPAWPWGDALVNPS
jgi:hypothetical protein